MKLSTIAIFSYYFAVFFVPRHLVRLLSIILASKALLWYNDEKYKNQPLYENFSQGIPGTSCVLARRV